jgi:hypothetical protein
MQANKARVSAWRLRRSFIVAPLDGEFSECGEAFARGNYRVSGEGRSQVGLGRGRYFHVQI